MPDALTEELIRQREEARDTKRQLGELAKTTGIQIRKQGNLIVRDKLWQVFTRQVTGNVMIWGNPTYGIWGTHYWGTEANAFNPRVIHDYYAPDSVFDVAVFDEDIFV